MTKCFFSSNTFLNRVIPNSSKYLPIVPTISQFIPSFYYAIPRPLLTLPPYHLPSSAILSHHGRSTTTTSRRRRWTRTMTGQPLPRHTPVEGALLAATLWINLFGGFGLQCTLYQGN